MFTTESYRVWAQYEESYAQMAGLLSRFKNGSGEPESDSPVLSEQKFGRAHLLQSLENSDLGWFWASDAEGRIQYISEPAVRRIGRPASDIVGRPMTEVFLPVEGSEDSGGERPLKFQLAKRNSIKPTTVRLDRGEGAGESWWEIAGVPQTDAGGKFSGYHGIVRDVSESFKHQRDAEKMSRYDSLTGLSNRHRMSSQLEATLTAFKASKRSCAIMLIDLDRFKQVNDTMGHPAGDELLKQVAGRLARVLGEGVEIGRIGGDEFEVIMPDVDDRGTLGDLAMRVIQMVSQPYSINGMRAVIGCSVGVAVAPFDGIESDELVKAADLALYSAKGGGRGQFRFYSNELRDKASYRHQIEADLRDAISRDELEMHYQPILDVNRHEVVCVEALMRWNHSERGMISPADFIPVAEEVGIIRELGAWALLRVCETIREWPGDIRAAVNVSAVQFSSEDFVDVVRRALKTSGVNPARVELEITESVFVGDMERAFRVFNELKELGVKLALDDFGTGYSSLGYLRDAPFDKIKIDQSFVRGCASPDNRNDAIISAVVSLASALGMETVAEGVETKDELRAVTDRGVSHVEGMLFARALPQLEIEERLATGELKFVPKGPEKYRSDRRTEFRKIGLIHGDDRYNVFLRNLSRTGAKIEGLLDVPVGTDIVLDLGGGQLAVATVRRSEGFSQGVEFETPLISDGADGLCTRHRVSPYQIEAAGRPLRSLNDEAVAALTGAMRSSTKYFVEVDITSTRRD
ncbi:putative bifunctional diguanylate cyclase/phosphodiesterase [Erythrobacter aurantius]|uniref:putative bifunctional diguanylate cyclase/phosphodiesterase n=1 Tax=Erythrobacter aurantius TaxID=2909249 RepID=UPI00207A56C5|nr:EAL domain-containing protein [Erythrobacter aurantius]